MQPEHVRVVADPDGPARTHRAPGRARYGGGMTDTPLRSPGPGRTAIAIVRHGETDWNSARRIQGRTEVPLNGTGIAQARESAELLRGAGPWRRVVSSPLGRAMQTASIIAEALGLPDPEHDEAVLERDFGPAEGLLVAEAEARWVGLEVPGAETLDALARRGAAAFARMLQESPGTIVVAHGALIRSALGHLGGAAAPRILNGEAWALEQADPRPVYRRIGAPAHQHPL